MKYCTKCGEQLMDEFVVCPKCGCSTGSFEQENSGSRLAIKVFMLLGCILKPLLLFIVPVIWCVPMTMYYFNAVKKKEKVGTAFKICTLLFVSLIAGIILLIDERDID